MSSLLAVAFQVHFAHWFVYQLSRVVPQTFHWA